MMATNTQDTGQASLPNNLRFFQRHPVLRRIVYVVIFETLAVAFTYLILDKSLGHSSGSSFITALIISLTAVLWNYVWNTAFEFFERRRGIKGRSFKMRALHAVGFETTLILVTVPVTAALLGITLLESLVLQAGLLVFFFFFTYIYAWIFDRIFGLPASAI